MEVKLKAKAIEVYNYVKEHEAENLTLAKIAEAVGTTPQSVNGIVTSCFQNHKEVQGEDKVKVALMERIPAEMQLPDGTHKAIKLIRLTDEGRNITIVPVEE